MDLNISQNFKLTPSKPADQSRNSILEAVLLIVISVLFFWFIVLPKKSEISVKAIQLGQLQAQKQTLDQQVTTLKSLIQSLNSNTNAQQVSELDRALPLNQNVVELNLLLNELAQSSSVSIGNISVSGQPNDVVAGDKDLLANPYGAQRTLEKLSGQVYVVGTFNQLESFMEKIQNSGRLIDVSDVELDSAPGGNLNLRLGVTAYYLGPQTP